MAKKKRSKGKTKNIRGKGMLFIVLMFIFIVCFSTLLYTWYHANKPIFAHNYVEDTFEDQIPGIFPAGWFSIVNPFNVRVVSDGDNKIMEVRSAGSEDVTEIQKKFKKTTEGTIQCKINTQNANARFVIHITQLDREYNPYDDIIIAFLEGEIHVVGEENLITLEDDPTFWGKIMLLNNNVSWAIDEQSLEDSVPLMRYEVNFWYSIKIEFNKERFLLTINEVFLGAFNYPRYNSPYFVSLYFVSFATQDGFRFYVDDVKITISNPVDYIHPLNIIIPILMVFFSSMIILCYFRFSKLKRNYN